MFVFPYSFVMQSYVFGNFEEQLTFDSLTDEDVVEVLNEVNQTLHGTTKDSLSLINLRDADETKGARPVSKLLRDGFPEVRPIVEEWNRMRATVARLALGLLGLPVAVAVTLFVLFAAGVLGTQFEPLVRLMSVYLPGLLAAVFLASSARLIAKKRVELGAQLLQTVQKDVKVAGILSKWNREKFHALNFSWSYKKEVDCLELSVDADLEVYESK